MVLFYGAAVGGSVAWRSVRRLVRQETGTDLGQSRDMKIYGRGLIKKALLTVYGPLSPLLELVGFDAKSHYEWLYWKSRQIEEGTLRNSWYEDTFTRRVGIKRSSIKQENSRYRMRAARQP